MAYFWRTVLVFSNWKNQECLSFTNWGSRYRYVRALPAEPAPLFWKAIPIYFAYNLNLRKSFFRSETKSRSNRKFDTSKRYNFHLSVNNKTNYRKVGALNISQKHSKTLTEWSHLFILRTIKVWYILLQY